MKSRLHQIEIRNFKSSLYCALYTFLQSARKPKNSIAKYFDPAQAETVMLEKNTVPARSTGRSREDLAHAGGIAVRRVGMRRCPTCENLQWILQ